MWVIGKQERAKSRISQVVNRPKVWQGHIEDPPDAGACVLILWHIACRGGRRRGRLTFRTDSISLYSEVVQTLASLSLSTTPSPTSKLASQIKSMSTSSRSNSSNCYVYFRHPLSLFPSSNPHSSVPPPLSPHVSLPRSYLPTNKPSHKNT